MTMSKNTTPIRNKNVTFNPLIASVTPQKQAARLQAFLERKKKKRKMAADEAEAKAKKAAKLTETKQGFSILTSLTERTIEQFKTLCDDEKMFALMVGLFLDTTGVKNQEKSLKQRSKEFREYYNNPQKPKRNFEHLIARPNSEEYLHFIATCRVFENLFFPGEHGTVAQNAANLPAVIGRGSATRIIASSPIGTILAQAKEYGLFPDAQSKSTNEGKDSKSTVGQFGKQCNQENNDDNSSHSHSAMSGLTKDDSPAAKDRGASNDEKAEGADEENHSKEGGKSNASGKRVHQDGINGGGVSADEDSTSKKGKPNQD